MTERHYRRADVEQMTGLSRSTIYELMKAGQFPKPVKITERAVAWRESDLDKRAKSRQIAS
jgi:prophage regulatory protein